MLNQKSIVKQGINAIINGSSKSKISHGNGILSNITISLKDNITTLNSKTTCASKILKDHVSTLDSTIHKKLSDSGAEIVGSTNMDEFGMGSFNTFSAYGPCLNPHDITRVTGGSSGGAAASISLGIKV